MGTVNTTCACYTGPAGGTGGTGGFYDGIDSDYGGIIGVDSDHYILSDPIDSYGCYGFYGFFWIL